MPPENRWRAFAMTRRKLVVIGAVVLVVVAAGIAVLLTGVGRHSTASPSSSAGVPADFVEFRDPQAGFALDYPGSWNRLQSSDPQVVLIAAQNAQNSFLVRVVNLPFTVGPQNIAAAKQLTDRIVTSNGNVTLLKQPEQIEVAGLPGYFYFYSFPDSDTGQTAVHSHFFLFKGGTMIAIVFQVEPLAQFPALAPTFDKIISTFRTLPA